MRVKKSGKEIYGAELTAAEKKAMNMEIARQLAVYTRKYQIEIESIFLNDLHEHHGFGETRLKKAFDRFGDDLDDLIKRYELGDEDKFWLATKRLKDQGYDIEQWHREKYPNDKD